MTQTIFVRNGPNLDALDKRALGIYGGRALTDIGADCGTLGENSVRAGTFLALKALKTITQ